jgi:hypothetical protein
LTKVGPTMTGGGIKPDRPEPGMVGPTTPAS